MKRIPGFTQLLIVAAVGATVLVLLWAEGYWPRRFRPIRADLVFLGYTNAAGRSTNLAQFELRNLGTERIQNSHFQQWIEVQTANGLQSLPIPPVSPWQTLNPTMAETFAIPAPAGSNSWRLVITCVEREADHVIRFRNTLSRFGISNYLNTEMVTSGWVTP